MRRTYCVQIILLLLSTTSFAQDKIEIALKSGTPREVQTKEQLQRLLKTYDLSKWIFTRSILIDEKAIPHSHPVLTLHTRHLKDVDLLLSTFVHEQTHWFLSQHEKETKEALKEVQALFAKEAPVGSLDKSDDEYAYIHILVNYLEYRADKELLGELKAKQVIEFWSTDHYEWMYKTVLARGRGIGTIMFKYKLVPQSRA
jgi:hypothetical protein